MGNKSASKIMKKHYLRRIRATLLKIGGKRLALQALFHPELLLSQGKVQSEDVMWCLGKPNECNANTADLWIRNRGAVQLCTGFALRKDVWYQHSWGRTVGVGPPQLLETTPVEWEEYFGFVLDDAQAANFAFTQHAGSLAPEQQREAFRFLPTAYRWFVGLLKQSLPDELKEQVEGR